MKTGGMSFYFFFICDGRRDNNGKRFLALFWCKRQQRALAALGKPLFGGFAEGFCNMF
jgi:hypothetical protein